MWLWVWRKKIVLSIGRIEEVVLRRVGSMELGAKSRNASIVDSMFLVIGLELGAKSRSCFAAQVGMELSLWLWV